MLLSGHCQRGGSSCRYNEHEVRELSKPPLPEGVEDHGDFQRIAWAVQRVSWIIFALILIAALLGLFGGDGYLSRSEVRFKQGTVNYPLISRWNASDELQVNFNPSSNDGELVLDSNFLRAFSIENIDPPQKAVASDNGSAVYVFSADPKASKQVIIHLKSEMPWMNAMTIGIGSEPHQISTFVFP